MRVPSATSIVFASLVAGGTLAAPTPSSPGPNSPSPNPNGLESPRFANSPGDVKSPRALNNSFFVGRNKVRRDRRPLGRKRSPSPKGTEPVGLVLRGDPAAAPMVRTLAASDGTNPQQVNAEGLGIIDQKTLDSLKSAVHTVAEQSAHLGPTFPALITALGDTALTLLGPNAPGSSTTPPSGRRSTPLEMRGDGSTTPDDVGGPVSAEGLGLVPPAVAQDLAGALQTIADALSGIPAVGPILDKLVGGLGGALGNLVSRSLHDARGVDGMDCPDDDGEDSSSDPAMRKRMEGFFPGQAQAQAQGLAQSASPYLAQAQSAQPVAEFLGPDGRIYEELSNGGIIAENAPAPARGGIQQASGLAQGAYGLAGSFPSSAQNIPGMALSSLPTGSGSGGFNPASTASNVAQSAQSFDPSQVATQSLGNVIGYLSNGLPVLSGGAGGPLQVVGGVLSGALGTAGGITGGLPVVGGLLGGQGGQGSPLGGLLSGVKGITGGLPVVGGLLGSLPVLGAAQAQGEGAANSAFGILDVPSSSTAPATDSTYPTATDSSSAMPTSTDGSDATAGNASWDASTTDSSSMATATPEGKDPADDNTLTESVSMTPYATASSTYYPSETNTDSSSSATPTASVPDE